MVSQKQTLIQISRKSARGNIIKWFKHDTGAYSDAKLMKVKHKYGMEGYGLYWHMIELIAGCVSAKNITFELEHDAEIIAKEWRIDQMRVQEMMSFMVNMGLFEEADGHITCLKLAKRLDDTNAKNPQIREIVNKINKVATPRNYDSLRETPSNSGQIRLDKIRLDKSKQHTPLIVVSDVVKNDHFDDFWAAYPKKVGRAAAHKAWLKLKPDSTLFNQILTDIQARVSAGAWCTGQGKAFIPGPGPYINQRKWLDEIIPRPEFKRPQDFSAIAAQSQEL